MIARKTAQTGARFSVVADLVGITVGQLAAEECGDLGGLDSVNAGPNYLVIDVIEVVLLAEDDIGGIFGLLQAPVIVLLQAGKEGAVGGGYPVEGLVQDAYIGHG